MSVCESPCNPCPKYCKRTARAYVGWMGWAGFIVASVAVTVMSLMVLGIIPQNWRIILGIVIPAIIIDLILWIVNSLRYAPCYSMQQLPSCEPCGCLLIVKGDPCDYAKRVDHDIRQSNDDGHLRTTIVSALFAFLLFGIFIAKYTTSGFDVPNNTSPLSVSLLYVIAKAVQVLILLAFMFSFRFLLENHSDLMYRHFTAIAESRIEGGETTVRYNNKNTPTASKVGRKNPLDVFHS